MHLADVKELRQGSKTSKPDRFVRFKLITKQGTIGFSAETRYPKPLTPQP